ncbi:MAG: valine--tRNA ligase [Thermoanaerobaculia bacterium]
MRTTPIIEMEKRFDPKSYESHWQNEWAAKEYFVCAVPADLSAQGAQQPYCIMIPPPNITGKLHMGHALQSTLQDLLTRWRRMQGRNALWLPGTDHAGIATQLMVERDLAKAGQSRQDLGRERFLERVWAWKEQYQGNIRKQLDLLGASCDWTRERFTLDEGLSRAVREAFVRLYEEGRITRGEYLVNWSTGLDTAISDLEVEMRPAKDKLWKIAYPIADSKERVVVATTRPETLLGDTALAVHPDDERYRHLLGKQAVVPIAGRLIPFVADESVERGFGTGVVKVTPYHDMADFETGRRHGLPGIQVIDRKGLMTAAAGAEFAGLDVEAARELVLVKLRAAGLLVHEEDYLHNVGFCQRSGVRVQPLMSTQWFCDVSAMAAQALAAQQDGRLELVPASWGKTWEHWLQNIRPWCISRQLWWGHQIPAWYDEAGRCFVARSREEAAAQAGHDRLTQDGDVLDTWFSSALWPFSTLGWPEKTADLAYFYPTSVLITGFDILFFWVARMAMMGLHFTGQSPFARVHLTGLVRDAEGVKMSKTKGNVLDPVDLVEEYGADAVRFTLALLDSPGRDIPLDPERMAGYRAFGNKIWNATRFALSKVGDTQVPTSIGYARLALPERWILSRLSETAASVDAALEEFRFDIACRDLYHFFWSDFCDWYIEMAKSGLDPGGERLLVKEVLLLTLDRALRLLHPVMPFLTEELWQKLPGHEAIHPQTICLSAYPAPEAAWILSSAETEEMVRFRETVTIVRNERADRKLTHRDKAELYLQSAKSEVPHSEVDAIRFLTSESVQRLLSSMAGIRKVLVAEPPPGVANRHIRDGVSLSVRFDVVVEAVDPEKLRLELTKCEENIVKVRARLESAEFVAKAPEAVIAGARKNLETLELERARLRAVLEMDSQAG